MKTIRRPKHHADRPILVHAKESKSGKTKLARLGIAVLAAMLAIGTVPFVRGFAAQDTADVSASDLSAGVVSGSDLLVFSETVEQKQYQSGEPWRDLLNWKRVNSKNDLKNAETFNDISQLIDAVYTSYTAYKNYGESHDGDYSGYTGFKFTAGTEAFISTPQDSSLHLVHWTGHVFDQSYDQFVADFGYPMYCYIPSEPTPHTHSMTKHNAVEATCAAQGSIEYYECTGCGKLFSDAQGSSEITAAATVVPMKAHSLDLVSAVAPTCSATGTAEHYHCSGCGKDFSDSTGVTEASEQDLTIAIDPDAHEWGNWTVTKPATEEQKGSEKRVCNHDASHVETRSIPVLSHVHSLTLVEAVAPSCENAGHSAYYTCPCGKFFQDAAAANEMSGPEAAKIAPLGHNWDEGAVTQEPTAAAEGVKTFTCDRCGATKTEKIAKLQEDSESTTSDAESNGVMLAVVLSLAVVAILLIAALFLLNSLGFIAVPLKTLLMIAAAIAVAAVLGIVLCVILL